MTVIRSFRNADPAQLLALWNLKAREKPTLYMAAQMDIFESQIFGNSLFDPKGLFLATKGKSLLGFVHASFGPDAQGKAPDHAEGVIYPPVIHPSRANDTGLIRDLILAAENYLLGQGANHWFAGGLGQISPFYTGLYGRSNPHGIFESEPESLAAFEKLDYQLFRRTTRMRLDVTSYRPRVSDSLLSTHRQFVSRRNLVWTPQNWWDANIYRNFLSYEWNVFPRDEHNGIAEPIAGAVVHQMLTTAHLLQNQFCMLSYIGVVYELLRRGIASVLFASLINDLQYESYIPLTMETMVFDEDHRLRDFLTTQGFLPLDSCQALCKIIDDFPTDPDYSCLNISPK